MKNKRKSSKYCPGWNLIEVNTVKVAAARMEDGFCLFGDTEFSFFHSAGCCELLQITSRPLLRTASSSRDGGAAETLTAVWLLVNTSAESSDCLRRS